VDGTGSGSCSIAEFGVSGVEPSASKTRDLAILSKFNPVHMFPIFSSKTQLILTISSYVRLDLRRGLFP
jgi:hypothetical protein